MRTPSEKQTIISRAISVMKGPVGAVVEVAAGFGLLYAVVCAGCGSEGSKAIKEMPPVVRPKSATPPVLDDSVRPQDPAGPFLT
ncbi:MAG: hypothetical protein ABL890_04500 [Candidatus Peribacteraceae bacterium]